MLIYTQYTVLNIQWYMLIYTQYTALNIQWYMLIYTQYTVLTIQRCTLMYTALGECSECAYLNIQCSVEVIIENT